MRAEEARFCFLEDKINCVPWIRASKQQNTLFCKFGLLYIYISNMETTAKTKLLILISGDLDRVLWSTVNWLDRSAFGGSGNWHRQ